MNLDSIKDRISGAVRSLRPKITFAATNKYLWFGIIGLLAVAAGLYVLINSVIMPTYTRYGVSVTVPDVREMSFEEARYIMMSRDLRVEKDEQQYNPSIPRDLVIDQDPAPNALVKPGRRVYLMINSGEVPTVSVPNLKDVSLRQARSQLAIRGLTVGEVLEDDIPSPYRNTITRQEPAAGSVVPSGTRIDLWVSRGLGEEDVVAPDLIGLTIAEAQDELQEARLRIVMPQGFDRFDPREDRITRQDPPAFTTVREGTEVRLYIEEIESVEVPDVSAMSISEARRMIADFGLEVGDVFDDSDAAFGGGIVTRQLPNPGVFVDRGERVTLWVNP